MIEGKRINLRTITKDDVDQMLSFNNQLSERGEYLPVNLSSGSMFQKGFSESGFWEEDFGKLLITDKQGNLLGDIAYFKSLKYSSGYEIGYSIYKSENRGKGYVSEALRIFSSYLFSLKPIPRLQICTMKGNIASGAVAKKCGFIHEGTLRKAIFARGKFFDLEVFGLLREECPEFTEVMASLK